MRLPWYRARLGWRIGVRQLSFLCLQLQAYVDAGFPFTEAWRLMGQSSDHPRLRRLCRQIHLDLTAGRPLREALRPHEGALPRFFINMMTSAERSGSYLGVLRTLQDHYAWLFSLKGEILRAVTYLLANLLLAKVVFLIRDFILAGIDGAGNMGLPERPAATLAAMLARHFGPVVIAIVAAWLLTTAMREWRRLRTPVDLLALTMPGAGGLLKKYCVANFCRMYATQTEAGLHPSNVYRDAASSMGNVILERRLLAWQRFVDDGEPVSEALRRAKVISFEVLALIESSEHAASAGDVLPRIADFEAEQVRTETRAAVKAMIPLMPFVIAGAFFGASFLARAGLPVPVSLVSFMDAAIFLVFFAIFLI